MRIKWKFVPWYSWRTRPARESISALFSTWNTFDWIRSRLTFVGVSLVREICPYGTIFESYQFKISAIFYSMGNLFTARITTNIPLNPLIPVILLDNPSRVRRLMHYLASDQSRIIARYINLLPTSPVIFSIAEQVPRSWVLAFEQTDF